MEILLTPPFAFLIYIPLVLIIYWIGRQLAGPEKEDAVKSSAYGSGESAPTTTAAPGYTPFFVIALSACCICWIKGGRLLPACLDGLAQPTIARTRLKA